MVHGSGTASSTPSRSGWRPWTARHQEQTTFPLRHHLWRMTTFDILPQLWRDMMGPLRRGPSVALSTLVWAHILIGPGALPEVMLWGSSSLLYPKKAWGEGYSRVA